MPPHGLAGGYGGSVHRLGAGAGANANSSGANAKPARTQPLLLPAEYDLSQKVRKLGDYRLRTPHRRHVQDKLHTIIAHWTDVPIGEAGFLTKKFDVELRGGDEDVMIAPVYEDVITGPVVNARCLIVTGLDSERASRHILRRVGLIGACQFQEEARCVAAYGGVVMAGSEVQVLNQMITLVKQQCNLDLSGCPRWIKWLEMQYSETGPTIFYVPCIWEMPEDVVSKFIMIPQCTEEVEEVEESYEEHVVDEEATIQAVLDAEAKRLEKDGDDEEEDEESEGPVRVMKVVQKKRLLQKVTRIKNMTPIRLSLANLVDFNIRSATDADTVEFICAADALDDFLKREMCTRIVKCLKDKHSESSKNAQLKTLEGERKRKREEEVERRQRARKEEIAGLTKKWAKEDEKMSEQQRAVAMKERQDVLKKRREKFAAEDKERAEKLQNEPLRDADGKAVPATESVCEQSLLDAFSYFDRLPGFTRVTGTLPRPKVENLLMALDQTLVQDDVNEMLDVPQIPRVGGSLPYKVLAVVNRERREVDTVD